MAEGMRIGILGLVSSHALLYADALSQFEDSNLVAAVTLGRGARYIEGSLHLPWLAGYPTTSEAYAERFNVQMYDDLDRFFDEASLDAVIICTEDYLRIRYAIRALSRGIHVFLPKPFASSLEEGVLLLRAAMEGRALVTPSLPIRYHPAYQRARDVVDSGQVGEPFSMHVTVAHHLTLGTWKSDASKAAGPEFEMGFYALDALSWLMSDTPTSLTAVAANRDHAGVPYFDTAKAIVQFSGGGLGSADFLLSPHFKFPSLEMSLLGRDAGVRIERRGERGGMAVTVYDRSGEMEHLVTPGSLYRNEMRHWIDTLTTHDQAANAGKLQAAFVSLQLCLAFKQSWPTQQPVSLPLPVPSVPDAVQERQPEDSSDDADDTIL